MKTLADPRDKAEILRRLGTLRPDTPRHWGRMSAPQMVCHLADSFLVALEWKQVVLNDHLFNRIVMKWVALHLPITWPTDIPTSPELDQVRGSGTKPGEFVRDVAQVVALTELVSSPGSRLEGRHPLFGHLSRAEWLRWGYLHLDHHLRQFGV